MKIIDQGIAIRSRPEIGLPSNCCHGICVLPTGRWLVGTRVGATKSMPPQSAHLSWSDDDGKTWTEPTDPIDPAPTINGMRGDWRALMSTPLGGSRVLATLYWVEHEMKRPFFNPVTQGLLDSRIFTSISEDAGRTWSTPRPVDTRPYDKVPVAITGATLVLPDGRWGCNYELNKHHDDLKPWHHAACMSFSSDEGRTWGDAVMTAGDLPDYRIFYWDQRLSVLRDGSILGLIWTFDTKTGCYMNIHAIRSRDNGRTWSKPRDLRVSQQPSPAAQLGDGRVVMAYVDRAGAPAIKARLSSDNGESFPDSTEITIHKAAQSQNKGDKANTQDALDEMGKFSLGLPHAAAHPSGDVVVAYYTGTDQDHTDIAWVRLRG